MKQSQLIKIEWIDANNDTTWRDLDEALFEINKTENAHSVSVGFFIKETDKFISIAQSMVVGEDDKIEQVSEVMSIPKVCIKKVKKLK